MQTYGMFSFIFLALLPFSTLNTHDQTIEVTFVPNPHPNSTCRYCSTDEEDMDIALELLPDKPEEDPDSAIDLELLPDEEDSNTILQVSDTNWEDFIVSEV